MKRQPTPREQEVLAQIARGIPNKAIARELGISPGTVKTHVSTLLKMYDMRTRTQLAVLAVRQGAQ